MRENIPHLNEQIPMLHITAVHIYIVYTVHNQCTYIILYTMHTVHNIFHACLQLSKVWVPILHSVLFCRLEKHAVQEVSWKLENFLQNFYSKKFAIFFRDPQKKKILKLFSKLITKSTPSGLWKFPFDKLTNKLLTWTF